MGLRYLPVAIFILPVAAANLAWLISTANGTIPSCFPYVDGCVSISGASRQLPSLYLFRGLIIPNAILTGLFWVLVYRWLGGLGLTSRFHRGLVTALGVGGSVFLIVYAVTLGSDGSAYRIMRRYGINLYYGLTYLAQILLAGYLLRQNLKPRWIARWKVGICVATLLLGLASIPTKEWAMDRRAMSNIFEWNLSILLVGYYLLTHLAWRKSGFVPRWMFRASVSG